MRKPKTARQKLIKANDDLFREIIRARDKVCQRTRRTENLQVCHFYTRSKLRVRWFGDNACLLNAGNHQWAHKYPQLFREFWLKRLGKEKFEALELKARYVAPVKTQDLSFINYDLKRQIKLDILHNLLPGGGK